SDSDFDYVYPEQPELISKGNLLGHIYSVDRERGVGVTTTFETHVAFTDQALKPVFEDSYPEFIEGTASDLWAPTSSMRRDYAQMPGLVVLTGRATGGPERHFRGF